MARIAWDAPTAVYRAYSVTGALLYAGISTYPEVRLKAHKHSAEWAFDFSHATCKWFGNRRLALGAELRAIRAEHPVFNTTGALCRCGRMNTCGVCVGVVPAWVRKPDRWETWAHPPEHTCPAGMVYGPGLAEEIVQERYIEPTADDPWPYDFCTSPLGAPARNRRVIL